jgi:sigma-B regulation protein RsbU (phosphoserine phosphatase)
MRDWQLQAQALGKLQRHLLPQELPNLPGWRLAVHYVVGPWPSGDYYDFLPLNDGRLAFVIGSAREEGMLAAVLVAMVRMTLHACPLTSGIARAPFCPMRGEVVQSPHLILGNLNRVLVENTLADQRMRLFCGLLNPVRGGLHFASAGHPPPRWWHARTRTVEALRDPMGLRLGVSAHASFHHKRVVIEPGDLVVFYTSGVTAAAYHDEGFGCARLDQAVREFAPRGADAVQAGALARLGDFMHGRVPQDDVTLVVFERRK